MTTELLALAEHSSTIHGCMRHKFATESFPTFLGQVWWYWILPPKLTWPQLLIFPHAIAKPRRHTECRDYVNHPQAVKGICGSNHLQQRCKNCHIDFTALSKLEHLICCPACERLGFPSSNSIERFRNDAWDDGAHRGLRNCRLTVWPPSCWRVEFKGWRLVHRVFFKYLQLTGVAGGLHGWNMKPLLNRNDQTTSIHQLEAMRANEYCGRHGIRQQTLHCWIMLDLRLYSWI